MQADTYVQMRQTAPAFARNQERQAFDAGIALMEAAQGNANDSQRSIDAVRHMQRLWSFLIKDLADPSNDLSDELKANLISIGLWVLKETDAILAGTSANWNGLIDINRTVREGLST